MAEKDPISQRDIKYGLKQAHKLFVYGQEQAEKNQIQLMSSYYTNDALEEFSFSEFEYEGSLAPSPLQRIQLKMANSVLSAFGEEPILGTSYWMDVTKFDTDIKDVLWLEHRPKTALDRYLHSGPYSLFAHESGAKAADDVPVSLESVTSDDLQPSTQAASNKLGPDRQKELLEKLLDLRKSDLLLQPTREVFTLSPSFEREEKHRAVKSSEKILDFFNIKPGSTNWIKIDYKLADNQTASLSYQDKDRHYDTPLYSLTLQLNNSEISYSFPADPSADDALKAWIHTTVPITERLSLVSIASPEVMRYLGDVLKTLADNADEGIVMYDNQPAMVYALDEVFRSIQNDLSLPKGVDLDEFIHTYLNK